MIRSIFILNNQDILMERHYLQPTSREIPQQFCLIASQYARAEDVPSIMLVNDVSVAHYVYDQLTFLAVIGEDCNAYAPLQFLQRLAIVFSMYGGCTVDNISDNYFTLYQVLEEICDGGMPLTTDLNVLTQIVPVSVSWKDQVEKIQKMLVSGKNTPKTTSMQSNITRDLPNDAMTVVWRPKDVSHTVQSLGHDFNEVLTLTCDEAGLVKASNCQGRLEIDCRMSGSPEVHLEFQNPQQILDASLAKNVSITAWNRDKSLHITPLDGVQIVACYKALVDMKRVPLEIRVDQQLAKGKRDFVVSLSYFGQLQKGELGQPKLEDITVEVPLADYDLNSESTKDGTTSLDLGEANRYIQWKVKLNDQGKAELVLKLEPRKVGHIARCPVVSLRYRVTNYLISGLQLKPSTFTNSSGKVYQSQKQTLDVRVEVKN